MHPDFEALSRFALREATAAEAAEVEVHLRDCSGCRQQARELALMELGLERSALETEAATPCPDAAAWAAYADGELSEGDQQQAEKHLLSCDDCVHGLLVMRRLRDSQVPEHLIEEARRLSPSPAPAARAESWILLPVQVPRWAAIGFSLAMAVLLVLLSRGMRPPASQPFTPAGQESKTGPDQQQIWEVLSRLKPQNGRVSFLAVTPALQQSMDAYDKNPDRRQRDRLLEQLQKLEPALPVQKIESVDLKSRRQGREGQWIALQWSESRLEILSLDRGNNPQ